MRKLVNLVVIDNRGILLVNKGGIWIFPGGEPEKEESDLGYLIKKIKKQFPNAKFSISSHYKKFVDEKNELKAEVYFGGLNGPLGKSSSEINGKRFVDSLDKYTLSDITKKIITSLIKDDRL